MHRRKIKAVYWPDNGEGLKSDPDNGIVLIWYCCEVAGTWIVKEINYTEVARYNPRFIDYFEWE